MASAPQLTYQAFLSRLAAQGYGVIAAPFLVQPNHQAIAQDVALSFMQTYQSLCQQRNLQSLPIYGLGHSLGAKLQLLLTCQQLVPRHGNILG